MYEASAHHIVPLTVHLHHFQTTSPLPHTTRMAQECIQEGQDLAYLTGKPFLLPSLFSHTITTFAENMTYATFGHVSVTLSALRRTYNT